MTKNEKVLLGLYTFGDTGKTVLKAWLQDMPVYCWPTNQQLADLLENRIEVHEALTDMQKTKEDLTPLTSMEAFRFGLRCYLDMPDSIMELQNVVVHPNFYYVFRVHKTI